MATWRCGACQLMRIALFRFVSLGLEVHILHYCLYCEFMYIFSSSALNQRYGDVKLMLILIEKGPALL